jgi:DNA-binding Xre family transcriptional regulator
MAKIVTKARQLRLNLGAKRGTPVTLQEVADAADIERGALNRIELGKTRGIDFTTLEKLCAYYKVGVGDILEYDPNILTPGHAAISAPA